MVMQGSARVLLQRLQGPMEEDTLKVHLEHIVRVVHKFKALKQQVSLLSHGPLVRFRFALQKLELIGNIQFRS